MCLDRSTNSPRDHPRGHSFYSIVPVGGGLVDVYLNPQVYVYRADSGAKEYDCAVLVVRGVEDSPDLESQIRANFYDWCASGERIYL